MRNLLAIVCQSTWQESAQQERINARRVCSERQDSGAASAINPWICAARASRDRFPLKTPPAALFNVIHLAAACIVKSDLLWWWRRWLRRPGGRAGAHPHRRMHTETHTAHTTRACRDDEWGARLILERPGCNLQRTEQLAEIAALTSQIETAAEPFTHSEAR
jgi:hypothetical protein